MSSRKVFMFSGQGSQYYQMGRALYEKEPVFRFWMQRLDRVASDVSGGSVVEPLYDERRRKAEPLDRLSLSHPAIFMVEFALARTLIEAHCEPDIVLGASLGTFAAAAVAGCLSAEAALQAVFEHAYIVEARCGRGAMIAILADPKVFASAALHECCDLAAVNFDSHFVVAADRSGVSELKRRLDHLQLTYQEIPVAFPFHSRWIDPAAESYLEYLQTQRLKAPTMPFACCATGGLLDELSTEHFWEVTRKPILFRRTVNELRQQGSLRFIDVGPSGTLATFVKYLSLGDSATRACAIMSPINRDLDGLSTLMKEIGAEIGTVA